MPTVRVSQTSTPKVPPRVHPLTRFPSAKLFYSRGSDRETCQIWDLGNGQLYKFRPHKRGVYESDIHTLIQRATTIPIPTIYREWVSSDGGGRYVHHMIMQKVRGEPLYQVWTHLNGSEKERLVTQFANYLDQLRRVRSSAIRSFEGGPIYDEHGFLFYQRNAAHGPFSDNQSLFLALTSHLRQNQSPEMRRALNKLRSIMPNSLPSVLTHADLHQGNIMVHNGNIAAIIDWEGAGFFPSWMEFVRYYPASNSRQLEFENAVVRRMDPHPEARRFKMILDALGSSERRTVDWGFRKLGC
ncbi:kinase-like protein [Choiromyces venosus 120613-1]|uniref:Kinase-like protein n=1 Tax=Choiromyces venosus 120613-1 TaxID=1336337 RepID=A0A3N4JHY5_9PEZI|nr:kinase-like protein [Choiromyces venosus 120613-1]